MTLPSLKIDDEDYKSKELALIQKTVIQEWIQYSRI